jgi:hypothetical protein
MTIFKNSKDGKLYTIRVTEKDGIKKYDAIPVDSKGEYIPNCDRGEFSIHLLNNGPKNMGFL